MVEKKSRIIQALFVCITFAFFLFFTFISQNFLIFLCSFVFLVTYFILFTKYSIPVRINKLTSWTMGALYCGGFTGVVTHGVTSYGGKYFLALLILSFVTDTFAYLGGRLFGSRPLAPKISPKKTVEGALAGLVGGSACGFAYLQSLEHHSSLVNLVIVCVAASLFSQVGDLFESTIKRYSGVKDSGRIMPGHGGVLDRIDGLLFAGPIVYIWMDNFL